MPDVVRVRGLKQFDRALGKADKALRSELRTKLKGIAEMVAGEARSIAASRTSRGSGDLVRGIRPFVLSGRAGVRSNAVHRGFEYPRRLEFEGRGGGVYGPRASLNPAVDHRFQDISRATEDLLDDIADEFSGGK